MRICSLLVLVVTFACSSKSEDKPKDPGPASAVAPATDGVEVFVDEASAARVSVTDLAKWPRLDSLVPHDARRVGTWMALSFTTGGGASKLERPAQAHPDTVPALFPGKDGKPAFGMFDAVEYAKHGEPAFRVDDVRTVKLELSKQERGGEHQGGGGEGADITKLVLEITTKGGTKQLTGPEILKLPREAQPNNDDTKGWRITQFLEAAGVKDYTAVTLFDGAGASLPLTKQDLDPATHVPFVKLNKSGVLRFRMFEKQGAGWAAGADLRGLAKIEVK